MMKRHIFLLISLFIFCSLTKAEVWVPPIGIPEPEFGISETYRMYDDVNNQNPDLIYRESDSGGYYTHYVHYGNPNATDSSNEFGTKEKPRKTIPYGDNIPAGSIIEVHGNYTLDYAPYRNYLLRCYQPNGTEQYPIFVRGVNSPVITGMDMRIGGSYYVIEGFEFVDSRIITYSKDTEYSQGVFNHIGIRNNEIHNSNHTFGAEIQFSKASNDIVIYDNSIHHNGLIPLDSDSDVHAILIQNHAQRVWIVNNEIYQNDGDSIQLHGDVTTGVPTYVYIGFNVMYGDRENAIDLKDCDNVIISQNDMFGYTNEDRVYGNDPEPRPIHHGTPTAVISGNESAVRTWVMFNKIHDNYEGIRADQIEFPHNGYWVGNLLYNNECAMMTYKNENIWAIFNVVYNSNVGFCSQNNANDNASYTICNNIFMNMYGTFSGYTSTGWIWNARPAAADATIMENNIFYDGDGFRWGNNKYSTLAAFKSGEIDKGLGCIEIDPLFTNLENGELILNESSPFFSLETSDHAQTVFDLFLQLYGINLEDDVEGLLPLDELCLDTETIIDDSGDNNNDETNNIPDSTMEAEDANPSVPAEDTSSSTPLDEESSSNPPIRIEPLPISADYVDNEPEIDQGGISTISTLSGSSDEGLHVDNTSKEGKVRKVRKIKVRKIFSRYDDLYNASNRGVSNRESYE